MGEAKRREQAAQAAGHASANPVAVPRSAMLRIRGLMERAQQAAELVQLVTQHARTAQAAYEQGVLQALQDRDIALPAGEGQFWWEFHWADATIGWRFTPNEALTGAPPPGAPAAATPPGSTSDTPLPPAPPAATEGSA